MPVSSPRPRTVAPSPASALRPRNLLEEAARIDDKEAALALVQNALGIQTRVVDGAGFCDQRRWARIDQCQRLMHIRDWLRAECHEVMDLVEAPSPMDTVGTND